MQTGSIRVITGFSKMWSFGSSTSQSRSCICSLSLRERARLVATSVLPVPPLPLATEIIILLSDHPGTTLGTAHIETRCTLLMGYFFSAAGAHAVPPGTSPGAGTTHSATPSSRASRRTSSISFRHNYTSYIWSSVYLPAIPRPMPLPIRPPRPMPKCPATLGCELGCNLPDL